MMNVWILRPDLRRTSGPPSLPVKIFQVTPDGAETEIESFTSEAENAFEATEREGLLKDFIYGEIAKERRHIVLDLATLDKPMSSNIGEIFAAFHHTKNSGGDLVLVHLTPRTQDVFMICRLDRVIPVFDSVPDAVQYLESRFQAPVEQHE